MPRELKFRAYIPEYSQMLYLDRVDLDFDYEDGNILAFSEGGYEEFRAHEARSTKPNRFVMQYTGIKDMNGTEVWEKDVLQVTMKGKIHPIPYVVQNLEDLWVQFNHVDQAVRFDKIKVMGNIYENRELVTGIVPAFNL